MITGHTLSNRMMSPDNLHDRGESDGLTARQREVAALVSDYRAVAHEWPSAGWLSRRLNISRQRARHHIDTIRERLR